MEKLFLKQFSQGGNLAFIQDPQMIPWILEKMWDLPFEKTFHTKYTYKNPGPWACIWDEFRAEELVDGTFEAFQQLSFGEVLLLLEEQTRRNGGEEEGIDAWGVFAHLYHNFI